MPKPIHTLFQCSCIVAMTSCGDGPIDSSAQALTSPPHLVFGDPLPPPNPPRLGQITVEGVEGRTTKVMSRLDNPELRTLIQLPDYSTRIGDGFFLDSQAPSLDAQNVIPGFVSFEPGDLQMYGSGVSTTGVDGDGVPLMTNRGTVAASLVPWPEASVLLDGGNGDAADLYARGVRLGYTPLTIETRVTNPNGTLASPLSSISVSLDPDVVLVPVQVFVINSASIGNYGGLGNVKGNLEVWDQVPSFLRFQNTIDDGPNSPPLIDVTSYSFGSWFGTNSWGPTTAPTWETFLGKPATYDAYRPQGKLIANQSDASAVPDNSNYFTPDSIWRDCGVQFRLVRFETVDLTDDDCSSIARGAGCSDKLNDNTERLSEDLHTLCDQFESVVVQKKLGGNLPTIPTLIVSYRLANATPNGQGEVAITVDGFGESGPVSCVGSQAESAARWMTLAHEVGHWAGGALEDDCGTEPSGSCQIDSFENQHAPPSEAECKTMHSWAMEQWSNFWVKPCAPPRCVPQPLSVSLP